MPLYRLQVKLHDRWCLTSTFPLVSTAGRYSLFSEFHNFCFPPVGCFFAAELNAPCLFRLQFFLHSTWLAGRHLFVMNLTPFYSRLLGLVSQFHSSWLALHATALRSSLPNLLQRPNLSGPSQSLAIWPFVKQLKHSSRFSHKRTRQLV